MHELKETEKKEVDLPCVAQFHKETGLHLAETKARARILHQAEAGDSQPN